MGQDIVDPIKTRIKREDYSVVITIMTVLVAYAFFVIFNVYSNSYYDKQISLQQTQSSLIQQVKFHFKTQVQEWKNILLRGHDAEDYDEYYSAFSLEHETVQKLSFTLSKLMNSGQLTNAKLEEFRKEHLKLFEEYNSALMYFDANDDVSVIKVDQLIRGIDRAPTMLLEELDATITSEVQSKIDELNRHRRMIEAIVSLLVAIALIYLSRILYRFAKLNRRKLYAHGVTDAYNKSALYISFDEFISTESHITLLLADIDNFKTINEVYGTAAADGLLKELACYFKSHPDVLLFHISSNFFVIIPTNQSLPSKDLSKLMKSRLDYFNANWHDREVSLSFTSCVCSLETKGISADELFNKCSAAMQESKASGKGLHHWYEELSERITTRQSVMRSASSIEKLMSQNKLALFGQAIVPNNSPAQLSHFEILLRINENGTYTSPHQVLEAAEKYDKSHIVDKYVIESVFDTLLSQSSPCQYSINISGKSLSHKSFVSYLIDKISMNRHLASRLTFELTETAVVSNLDAVKNLFGLLRTFGCKVAIDDFGVGESSLRYLLELSVDIVKIDGFFIRQLEQSAKAKALVGAIITVCNGLGVKTVAEFVEDQNLQEIVTSMGITYSQGFGIHTPQPMDECGKL